MAYVFIVMYWVSHMCYHIFISSSFPFALKMFPKKPIFCFCFMILIPSFVSLRILMIFFVFFSFKSSLLCIQFYSQLLFLFDYFVISFSCWLFFSDAWFYSFVSYSKVSDLKSWGALRLWKRLVFHKLCCRMMRLNSLVVKTLTSPSIGLFP